ncbi:MAG: hypothetical protein ACQER6_08655 [Pseudomonadota bacterium]
MVDRKRVIVGLALLGAVLSTAGRADAVEDPFRPPQGPVEPVSAELDERPEGLEVSMILRGPGRSAAVIGERTLGVGDRIEGFAVVAIDRGRVILERDGERIEVEPSSDLRSIRSSVNNPTRQPTGTP